MCMAGCYVCESVQEQIGQVLAKIWALKYDTIRDAILTCARKPT